MKRGSEFNGNAGCGEASSSTSVGMLGSCPCLELDELSGAMRGMQGARGPAASPSVTRPYAGVVLGGGGGRCPRLVWSQE